VDDDKSLLYACVIDDLALIRQRLAGVTHAQLKQATQDHGTPLHAAALVGNRTAVDLLLAAGADLERGNFVHDNAMLTCVEKGKLDMARYLLEKGSNPTRKGCQNRDALNKLVLCAWDRDFADYLLTLGLDVNTTAVDKQNLLGDAASINNVDAIDWLLAHGANPDHLNDALSGAIWYNAVDAAALLLDKGADLDAMYAAAKAIRKSIYHWTAISEHRGPMIRFLIARGVDFSKVPPRPVSATTGTTKLCPLDYAKERLGLFPQAKHIAENIAVIENPQD